MNYPHITDDMLAKVIATGFPSMQGRLTAGELRWLWEAYSPEAVDAAMWEIECRGRECGDPFDEVRRMIQPRRPRMALGGRNL